jgi:3-deoxy-D-manno-octulosonic-acid transferase
MVPEDTRSASMWILYQLVVALALLLAGPFLLLLRGKHYLPTIAGRFGAGATGEADDPLWIHAVSVGEVGVARTLIEALPASTTLLVTTITPTGQAGALEIERADYQTAYLPFELGIPIRRFLRRFSPRALVLCEGDYWPLLLHHVSRRDIPVAVINGRVSDRSFARMRSLRPLLGPLFDSIGTFGVQSAEDQRRLVELGVEPSRIRVTGNLKFDAATPDRPEALEQLLGGVACGRPLLIAGSTMAGEEQLVLEAFEAAGGGEQALLVLAPRHPERWDAVETLIRSSGARFRRRSQLTGETDPPTTEVVLLDSMGELAGLYAICRAAFVGGTLVPTGGHNPIEPARFGAAIAAGPSMENFRAIATEFDRHRAWIRVENAGELTDFWRGAIAEDATLAASGKRAAELIDRNRGALTRTLDLLQPRFVHPGGATEQP